MKSLSRLSLAVATILLLVGTGLTWTIYRTEVAAQQAEFDVLAQRAARRIEIRIEPMPNTVIVHPPETSVH